MFAVWEPPAVVLITGIMAAGKSTVVDLPATVERIRHGRSRWSCPREETADEILARAWTDGRIG